jgi:uncharacterized protein YndB with AHSA1/START domain
VRTMVEVNGEILIERPVEQVFDFVANQENEPQYNPEMRVAKKITEGPIGVGTSFHAEMTGRGRVVPMTIWVTEFERPHQIRERVEMRSMDLTGGLDFEPIDGGTRMRWHWDLSPSGVLRFMGPLVAGMGRRQEQRIWSGLKRVLESRASVLNGPTSATARRASIPRYSRTPAPSRR